jgi:hypothetical protein
VDLAAIPEADTPTRRSKRRADTADQPSLERAERIKAARNMDATPNKGNITMPQTSFLQQFFNEHVVKNLTAVGISLGTTTDSISSSVACVTDVELKRLQKIINNDKICSVFDKEEKEENEEVDKLILNSHEIMGEVMDLDNALQNYSMMENIFLSQKQPKTGRISE